MRRLLWALGLAVLSCGGDGGTGPAIVASMEVTPGSWLAVGVEDTLLVTSTGLQNMTPAPSEIITL